MNKIVSLSNIEPSRPSPSQVRHAKVIKEHQAANQLEATARKKTPVLLKK